MPSKKKKIPCALCGKPIKEGVYFAMGKAWHKGHFICNHCEKPLVGGKFIEEDGKPYCEPDWNALFLHKNAPICAHCNEPVIKETALTAMGKTWHKDHFFCTSCQTPFKGTKYYEDDGMPYCEKHFQKTRTTKLEQYTGNKGQASGSKKTEEVPRATRIEPHTGGQASGSKRTEAEASGSHAMGGPGGPGSGRSATKSPAKGGAPMPPSSSAMRALALLPTCPTCNEPILDFALVALGKKWHTEHLLCAHCKNPITERTVNIHDDKPYCNKDYSALFGKKCSACGKVITDPAFLMALNKYWHKNCLTCKKCKKNIQPDQDIKEKKGKPQHLACK